MAFTSPSFGEVWKYTDDKGSTHYVNYEIEIPAKFRKAAEKIVDIPKLGGSGEGAAGAQSAGLPLPSSGVESQEILPSIPPVEEATIPLKADTAIATEQTPQERSADDILETKVSTRYFDVQYAFSFNPPRGFKEIASGDTGAQAYYVSEPDETGFVSSLLVFAHPAEYYLNSKTKYLNSLKEAYISQWTREGYIASGGEIYAQGDDYLLLELFFSSVSDVGGSDIALLIYQTFSTAATFQFRLPHKKLSKYQNVINEIKCCFENDGISFSKGEAIMKKKRKNTTIRITLAAGGALVFIILFWLALRSLREL